MSEEGMLLSILASAEAEVTPGNVKPDVEEEK